MRNGNAEKMRGTFWVITYKYLLLISLCDLLNIQICWSGFFFSFPGRCLNSFCFFPAYMLCILKLLLKASLFFFLFVWCQHIFHPVPINQIHTEPLTSDSYANYSVCICGILFKTKNVLHKPARRQSHCSLKLCWIPRLAFVTKCYKVDTKDKNSSKSFERALWLVGAVYSAVEPLKKALSSRLC